MLGRMYEYLAQNFPAVLRALAIITGASLAMLVLYGYHLHLTQEGVFLLGVLLLASVIW